MSNANFESNHDLHERNCNCEECGAPICACLTVCDSCLERSEEQPEPDIDDSVRFCPDCERPNQFGEICASCERDAEEAAQRWHDEREPESGRYFAS